MQQSNNRYTRALEIRYTRDNLNGYAAKSGMSSTKINWNCNVYYYWQPNSHSTWRLDDVAKLYEAIDNGTAVPTSMLSPVMVELLTSTVALIS